MYTSLISAPELDRLLRSSSASVLLFDCHHELTDPEAGRRQWTAKRIDKAGFLHLDEDLSGPVLPGRTGRHPLPAEEDFAATVRSKGWHDDVRQQVVVYDAKGGGIAARSWWLFKRMGHEAVAVLDGGLPAWEAFHAGKGGSAPLTNTPVPSVSTKVTAVDRNTVDSIRKDKHFCLVDSRTAPRYRGEEEPIDPVAGHIPGAINLPWPDNLGEDGKFRSLKELKNRFAPLRNEAAQNVFYCGSGVTACHNILAYYHAFGAMPALYPGSWSEWILE